MSKTYENKNKCGLINDDIGNYKIQDTITLELPKNCYYNNWP